MEACDADKAKEHQLRCERQTGRRTALNYYHELIWSAFWQRGPLRALSQGVISFVT